MGRNAGRPKSENGRETYTNTMDSELLARLRIIAVKEKVPYNSLIDEAVRKLLGEKYNDVEVK